MPTKTDKPTLREYARRISLLFIPEKFRDSERIGTIGCYVVLGLFVIYLFWEAGYCLGYFKLPYWAS